MNRRLTRREELAQLAAANPVFAWGSLMSIVGTLVGTVRYILAVLLLDAVLTPAGTSQPLTLVRRRA